MLLQYVRAQLKGNRYIARFEETFSNQNDMGDAVVGPIGATTNRFTGEAFD